MINMRDKPTVYLWHSKGLGAIFIAKSGVYYSNQTGGYGCLHPAEEGYYVPFVSETIDQEKELQGYFEGPKWNGWCNQGIDEEAAEFIDALLNKSSASKIFKVDRSRMNDSHEAWIYVEIVNTDTKETDIANVIELNAMKAVLTWENSD